MTRAGEPLPRVWSLVRRQSFRFGVWAVVAALAAVLAPRAAQAQIVSLPPSRDPQFHNAIGIAGSVGPFIGRDAHFWGLAIDYTRRLQHGWSIGGSIAWDEDRERLQDGSRKVVHAFNAVVTVNYSFQHLHRHHRAVEGVRQRRQREWAHGISCR